MAWLIQETTIIAWLLLPQRLTLASTSKSGRRENMCTRYNGAGDRTSGGLMLELMNVAVLIETNAYSLQSRRQEIQNSIRYASLQAGWVLLHLPLT